MPTFSGGGAERVMISLANVFYRRGIDVDLVVLRAHGPYYDEVADGVRIVDLGVNRAAFGVVKFATYLRKSKPEVVLVTMKHVALCAYVGRILAFSRPATRLFIREAISPAFNDGQQGLSAIVMGVLFRHIYKNVDAVVSTTAEMTDDLLERFCFKRIETIGNPVVTENFKKLAEQYEDCQWPWPSGEKIVLSVGRLSEQKDFATLVDAFALVCESTPARLVILGEGESRDELEAQVDGYGLQDRVWMPGFVSNPFAYMAGCDLYVMSSVAEGLPNALIQALCTGTPVVSTRCPTGPLDLLEDGKYGHLVDVGDVKAMAVSIVDALASDRKNAKRQSHFVSKFNEDTISDQYLDILFGQAAVDSITES